MSQFQRPQGEHSPQTSFSEPPDFNDTTASLGDSRFGHSHPVALESRLGEPQVLRGEDFLGLGSIPLQDRLSSGFINGHILELRMRPEMVSINTSLELWPPGATEPQALCQLQDDLIKGDKSKVLLLIVEQQAFEINPEGSQGLEDARKVCGVIQEPRLSSTDDPNLSAFAWLPGYFPIYTERGGARNAGTLSEVDLLNISLRAMPSCLKEAMRNGFTQHHMLEIASLKKRLESFLESPQGAQIEREQANRAINLSRALLDLERASTNSVFEHPETATAVKRVLTETLLSDVNLLKQVLTRQS